MSVVLNDKLKVECPKGCFVAKDNALIKPSLFMQTNTPLFLNRFNIFYTLDGPQIQYCISEINTKKDISCSIEISMDIATKQINVLMFYPGLNQLPDTRYFSSVCFFLIIHHFTLYFHLTSQYSIFLHTKKDIYNSFYSHLIDFKFLTNYVEKNLMVHIHSFFNPMDVDVSMITERLIIIESGKKHKLLRDLVATQK